MSNTFWLYFTILLKLLYNLKLSFQNGMPFTVLRPIVSIKNEQEMKKQGKSTSQ